MISSTSVKTVVVQAGRNPAGMGSIAQAYREFADSDPRRSSLVHLSVRGPSYLTLDEARDFAVGLLAVVDSVAGEL